MIRAPENAPPKKRRRERRSDCGKTSSLSAGKDDVMHIQPGVVEGARMVLGYVTAAGSLALTVGMARNTILQDGGVRALVLRSIVTSALVLVFFQVFPHYVVGISEVHFIFGATLYLLFGAGPAAIGLAVGLLSQGLLFEPGDLPQYALNVTTLIAPLYLVAALAKRLVAPHTPYVELRFWQALLLSVAYQGGVILMVAFWAFYGQGFGAENIHRIALFAGNYLVVIIVEPILSMALLWAAKRLEPSSTRSILYNRLHHPVQ